MMQGNMIDLFYNELANKIIDGLDKLYHKYEKGAAERWIWELLQNAKDCCAGTQQQVKVEIEIDDHVVDFRHSGKPFTILDIQKLAHQTSQKARTEVKIDDSTGIEVPQEEAKLYDDSEQDHVKNYILD